MTSQASRIFSHISSGMEWKGACDRHMKSTSVNTERCAFLPFAQFRKISSLYTPDFLLIFSSLRLRIREDDTSHQNQVESLTKHTVVGDKKAKRDMSALAGALFNREKFKSCNPLVRLQHSAVSSKYSRISYLLDFPGRNSLDLGTQFVIQTRRVFVSITILIHDAGSYRNAVPCIQTAD